MVMSYYIAEVFFDLYKMAVDTIFLCFCEDSAHNDGKGNPYFMSDNLLKFMSEHGSNQAAAEASVEASAGSKTDKKVESHA